MELGVEKQMLMLMLMAAGLGFVEAESFLLGLALLLE